MKAMRVSLTLSVALLMIVATGVSASIDYVNNGKCELRPCTGTVTQTCKPSEGGVCSGLCEICNSTTLGDICVTSPETPTNCTVSNLQSDSIHCGNIIEVACAGPSCTCTGPAMPTTRTCKVKRCISN